MKRLTHATLLGLALSLAACGGGAGGSAALPSPNQNSGGTPANARILITIPAKAVSSARSSKPKYVSPATQSIAIQVDSGAATSQNLLPTSPNCSVSGPLGSLTCAVPIVAAAGAHTITFTTYDQPGATGNKLSTNSVATTIVANQLNTINATLAGIPASIQATAGSSLALTGSLLSGFAFGVGAPPLVIAALDADGNFIVGPGAPTLTVTVSGATSGAGIAVAASSSNPNEFTLSATSIGTATLSIAATPTSSTAGNALMVTTSVAASPLTTTIAGTATPGFVDGTGTAATFTDLKGVAYNAGNGDLYVTDQNNCAIRQVTPAGVVTTFAGASPATCGNVDGTGPGAHFSHFEGIAYDSANGDLYVTDTLNCDIRQVTSGGIVTTIAGSSSSCGLADGTGTAAHFSYPRGIAYDSANNDLYVTDTNSCAVRQVTTAGVVTTIAGNTKSRCGFADGTGNAAYFAYPNGIAYASNGDLYITDTNNSAIRQMTTAGVVTTIAGSSYGFADGSGSSAQFAYPRYVAYDSSDGNLYVTDSDNDVIRRVSLAGAVTTVAGSAHNNGYLDGLGTTAVFSGPEGIAYDAANGRLYVTDTFNYSIRQIQLQP